MSQPPPDSVVVVTPARLRDRPLPDHGSVRSKHDRGVVVIVGGSAETPGAVLLAGLAALRVGAGTLQIATAASACPALGVAIPEARVVAVPEQDDGSLDPAAAAERVATLVGKAHAVLIGSGALDEDGTGRLLRSVVPEVADATVVVDASAIPVLADDPGLLAPLRGRAVVMPNPAEMASLLGCSIDEVMADPVAAVTEAVARLGGVVTLRGTETWTAAPDVPLFRDEAGNPGLATSGSGDVLAGVITGLAARGADPLTATLWATHLHATAADRCAARHGEFGYLARELLAELPLVQRVFGG